MEVSGGIFQIRPHREFVPAKGHDRLLSLRLLSDLPIEDINETSSSDLSSNSDPRNAYDFMKRRREVGADPSLKQWNASIRLSNFASVDSSPLCVSFPSIGPTDTVDVLRCFQMSSVGALLDHLTRQRAVGQLDNEGLEIRDIESLALLVNSSIFPSSLSSTKPCHSDQVMQINADALLFVPFMILLNNLTNQLTARFKFLRTKAMLPSIRTRLKRVYHFLVRFKDSLRSAVVLPIYQIATQASLTTQQPRWADLSFVHGCFDRVSLFQLLLPVTTL